MKSSLSASNVGYCQSKYTLLVNSAQWNKTKSWYEALKQEAVDMERPCHFLLNNGQNVVKPYWG